MTERRKSSGRLQFLMIAAVFFGPLLIAAWLYYGGDALRPEGRTNSGALLEPVVNLRDRLPGSPLHGRQGGHWVLLYVESGECGTSCREALHTIRQLRLMLGREMGRLERVFLHGESAPDTLFLAEEHEGLITLGDAALDALLDDKKPDDLAAGGYYLIDPLGNLVMYFHPDLEPDEIFDDIKKLLQLSRIG